MTAGRSLRLLLFAVPALAQVSVLSYHGDLARTGQNLNETVLTPANVASSAFGKRFAFAVDGQVYAQPLYVPNVAIAGGTHNVIYVVTEHDSAYAFDADGATAAPLWQVSFLTGGATTVPNGDVSCGQIAPEIGITDTPAIDLASNTIYFVAMTKEAGVYVHRLHALDIATGAEMANSPMTIHASVTGTGDGSGTVNFIAKNYKERAGLLLLNGVVYTSWASHCDAFLYHGWLMGYDAKTLQQVSVYVSTENGRGGSFWTSGAAPSADRDGSIFVNGGNGDFNGNSGGPNLGESFIKLTPGSTLAATDYFTPFNYALLNSRDLDTGSSGIVLLPDSAGSAAHPHVMVSAGKEGRIYLVDRDDMGKFQAASDAQIVQSFVGLAGGLFGIPAYFNNTIYFCASNDTLKAFAISGAQMDTTPSSQSALKFGGMGGVPGISANGAAGGIVWMLQSAGGAALYAWDAGDLTKILYNSNNNKQDALGSYVKFSTPTIANGRVYAGTNNSVAVYGLGGQAAVAAVVSSASFQAGAAPGSLVTVFGANLASAPAQATGFPLPNTLGGVSVTVGGKAAPLYFAGASQINAQVPVDAAIGLDALVVSTAAGALAAVNLNVQAAAPAIFVLVNANGQLNTATQAVGVGGTVIVYLTGLGAVTNSPATGAAAVGAASRAMQTVTATIGGAMGTVGYAGLAPGYAGLAQVNLTAPATLAPGSYPLIVTVGGVASNPAPVWVGR
jgi:uncharacterized protein (TIGR03437 family)